MRRAPVGDEFAHGQSLGRGRVLRQDRNRLREFPRIRRVDIRPIQKHAPAERRLDAADGPQQRGFPAAVRTDERRDLPLWNLKGKILYDDGSIVARL